MPRGSVFIRSCELAVVQRGIGAALREQLRMFTLFSSSSPSVMFSRSTALILSGSFCSLRKSGEAPRMMKRAMTVMTASTARRISPMTQSFRNARMRFQKA